MNSLPLIEFAAAPSAAKLDAIRHVTWICETLRYLGWAALLLGFGAFFHGLARLIEAYRPRR